MEAPHKSRAECRTTTWGRRCSSNESKVFNLFPKELLPVIEASFLYQLPEQFNGRLSSMLLNHGHVDIVNKNQGFKSTLRTTRLLPFLLKFAFDVVLCRKTVSLSGEIQHYWDETLLCVIINHEVLNNHRLASACLTSYENWLADWCKHA